MSSRHAPLNGADSEYVLRPYLVVLGDNDTDERIRIRVPAAIGPRDAMGQARHTHPGWTPLAAEEELLDASRDYADAEPQRVKEASL